MHSIDGISEYHDTNKQCSGKHKYLRITTSTIGRIFAIIWVTCLMDLSRWIPLCIQLEFNTISYQWLTVCIWTNVNVMLFPNTLDTKIIHLSYIYMLSIQTSKQAADCFLDYLAYQIVLLRRCKMIFHCFKIWWLLWLAY